MIFTFRIVSDEVDNFRREIKIDADATFLDLKNAICDRSRRNEMKKLETGRNLIDPVCSMAVGKAPTQMMEFEEFEDKNAAKAKASAIAAAVAAEDMGEEFYGSEQFNDDEFSAEGFDEMNFDEKF